MQAYKGTNIWISEDYPTTIKSNRQVLMKYYQAAKNSTQINKCSLKLDCLYLDGNQYTVDSVHKILDFLQPDITSSVTTDDVHIFASKNAVLSNLHLKDVAIDGRIFNCNEQFIQYSKANLFKDDCTARKILEEADPYKQMEMGKQVKGFKKEVWLNKVPRFLHHINREKFL